MPTWSALDLAEPRSPCRDAQRQRAAPAIIVNQNRGSSHVYHAEITCICASFPPRIHAFGKPPTTLLQRSAVLRQLHFACSPCLSCLSDVSYQDASAGMRFMLFTGQEVFFRCSIPCLCRLHLHRFGGFSDTGMKIFLYKP